jgi:deoxyadenosine/deoxycytidine kinase
LPQPRFVLVGLPGSGKSTVGELVAAATGGVLIDEDPAEFDFLSPAFEAPERYAALGQIEFLLAKARDETAAYDRPVWQEIDTRYCHTVWSQGLWRAGRISSAELRLLEGVAGLLDRFCPAPTTMISLDLGWSELERRIGQRGREHESGGPRIDPSFGELLRVLHEEHRRFAESEIVGGAPLCRVDASKPVPEVVEEVLSHVTHSPKE